MRLAAVRLALVSLIIGALPAQNPLDIHTLVGLKSVSQAVLSPDGLNVAYLLSRPRGPEEADGPEWREIHLVSVKDGTSKPLYAGAVRASSLAWSTDGSRVVFLGKPKGDPLTRILAVSIQGGEPKPLITPDLSVRVFSLSPDGLRATFTATRRKSSATRALEKRGFNQTIYEEDLEPVRLYLTAPGTGAASEVTLAGSVHEISFAPDGKAIFFTMAPTPLVDDRYMARTLYRIDIEALDKKPTVVAKVPGKFGSFAISPDSSRVAFIAGRDRGDPHESSLYVVGREGGWGTSLTPGTFEGEVNRVSWLDDKTLLCLATEGCYRTLFTQPAGGGDRKTIRGKTSLSPGSFSFNRKTARLAVVASTSVHPNEVFLFEVLGAEPKRLTDTNPTLSSVAFGKQEVIRYTARDGLDIEGVLIHPVGRKRGQPSPLIVVVHGGPESCVLNGWITRYAGPGQVASGRGYAVFHPNYRSSTGRGVAFSKLGQGDAGGAEFDDVIDGIDHLIEQKLVASDKVGITGGSYGGYFTAWAATRHSERFAAAVMFVGISNQISKIGTTDIPNESFHSHWRKRPWDLIPLLLERSPITHTGNARTPLLIMHGKDDPRVSYTQSLELYRWIKIRTEVPVRLVLYAKEGHGNRRRASQLDYALRMHRWFDHFLVQGGKKKPPTRVDYR